MYLRVGMCVWVRAPTEVTEALGPLETELQVIVSHPTWVLGTSSGSVKKQQVRFTWWTISPALRERDCVCVCVSGSMYVYLSVCRVCLCSYYRGWAMPCLYMDSGNGTMITRLRWQSLFTWGATGHSSGYSSCFVMNGYASFFSKIFSIYIELCIFCFCYNCILLIYK